MFDYNLLGAGIKECRRRQGISVEELSTKLKIGRAYLLKIEQGAVKPSLALLIEICNNLNVGTNDLLEGYTDHLLYRQFKSEAKYLNNVDKRFLIDVIQKVSETEGASE